MYDEDELLPLSGIAHLLFCERRFALVHLEQQWEENVFTAEGKVLHDRADRPGHATRGDLRTAYALPLRSLRLGLSGRADVVEYHREGDLWRPFPVEYKRGRPKPEPWDAVQLCAQALCLEEMHQLAVPAGALFYGQTRHRHDIAFTAELRERTREAAARMHDLFRAGTTPPAVRRPGCRSCSLLAVCQPGLAEGPSARAYLDHLLRADDDAPPPAAGDVPF